MSAALQHRPITVAAFLEWEERQPIRYEFNGERPVAMAGGSLAHSLIAVNLARIVSAALRGGPCSFYNSDAKVHVAGRVRYPDGSVGCTPQSDPALRRQGVVADPVIVFEVLSEGTASADSTEKNLDYAATPSIRRYIMIEQDRIAATIYQHDGADWVGRPVMGAETMLLLPEVGIDPIRLGDLYDGVTLEAPPA